MESGSSDNEDAPLQFKVILLGNGAVGKTSLIRYYCQSGFTQNYKQTIGLDFYSKKVKIPGPKGTPEVQLHLWDIGGQQIGGTMLNNYIYGADAVCLVYDVTNRDSFKDLEYWREAVFNAYKEHGEKNPGELPKQLPRMYLVGNKVDLPHRQVEETTHKKVLEQYGETGSAFVSASSGDRVNGLFTQIAADLCGVVVKQYDIDLTDQSVAKVVSSRQEREVAERRTIRSVPTKKEGDCTIM